LVIGYTKKKRSQQVAKGLPTGSCKVDRERYEMQRVGCGVWQVEVGGEKAVGVVGKANEATV